MNISGLFVFYQKFGEPNQTLLFCVYCVYFYRSNHVALKCYEYPQHQRTGWKLFCIFFATIYNLHNKYKIFTELDKRRILRGRVNSVLRSGRLRIFHSSFPEIFIPISHVFNTLRISKGASRSYR